MKLDSRRFRVALSFPGAKRDFVRSVAEVLAKPLGKERVFYDAWYKSELAKPDLDLILGDFYHNQSELVVPFLCQDYGERPWCGVEWRQMRDLLLKGQGSRIMQFRFDREPIPGTLGIDGFIEIFPDTPENRANPERTVTPEQVAALILERLNPAYTSLSVIDSSALTSIHKFQRAKTIKEKDPVFTWFGYSIRQNSKTLSVLAIFETLAASALALYAAFAWGATIWFAAYILIAPLLLLKTKGSVNRGLKYNLDVVENGARLQSRP